MATHSPGVQMMSSALLTLLAAGVSAIWTPFQDEAMSTLVVAAKLMQAVPFICGAVAVCTGTSKMLLPEGLLYSLLSFIPIATLLRTKNLRHKNQRGGMTMAGMMYSPLPENPAEA